jgi:hypothetical protein
MTALERYMLEGRLQDAKGWRIVFYGVMAVLLEIELLMRVAGT